MEAVMVNPFVEGTLYILDTTAAVKVKPGQPFVKKHGKAAGDISGVLTVSGDISGTAAVSFTEQSILGVVSAMFGEEMTRIDEEITDAVGEIGNMISGHVTTKMTEMGRSIKVKLLDVITGKGHDIGHAEGKRVLVIPFRTTKGKVVVEVAF